MSELLLAQRPTSMRWSGLLSALTLQNELGPCQLSNGSGPWPVLTPKSILGVAQERVVLGQKCVRKYSRADECVPVPGDTP